jgi:hypothetical protein
MTVFASAWAETSLYYTVYNKSTILYRNYSTLEGNSWASRVERDRKKGKKLGRPPYEIKSKLKGVSRKERNFETSARSRNQQVAQFRLVDQPVSTTRTVTKYFRETLSDPGALQSRRFP